jgi:hypothetical protein
MGNKSIQVHAVLVVRPEGKRPFGRPRHRMENKLQRIFKKLEGVVWTGLI